MSFFMFYLIVNLIRDSFYVIWFFLLLSGIFGSNSKTGMESSLTRTFLRDFL